MMELGKRIRELRNRDGRTQEVLAEELGVTAQAVSRWKKEYVTRTWKLSRP